MSKIRPRIERIRSLNGRIAEAERLRERLLRMADKYDPWSAHSFLTSEQLIEFYNQYRD